MAAVQWRDGSRALSVARGIRAGQVYGVANAVTGIANAHASRALANRPALLDMVVTPEAVFPDARSGLARVPDLQLLTAWDEADPLESERTRRHQPLRWPIEGGAPQEGGARGWTV